jgi:hypothetical protein
MTSPLIAVMLFLLSAGCSGIARHLSERGMGGGQ